MAKLTDITSIIRKAIESKRVLEAAATVAIRSIPKRTRLGKGVQNNLGPTHKLPNLKTKTVKNRSRLKKLGQLSGQGATPKKSGLNKSGDMLDSLTSNVGRGKVEIKLEPNQQDKANALLKIDPKYQFMRLSAAEFKRVLKAMTKQIEQALSRVKFTDL